LHVYRIGGAIGGRGCLRLQASAPKRTGIRELEVTTRDLKKVAYDDSLRRKAMSALVLVERIERMILLVRGEKAILDRDLAVLYGVEVGALNRAVKRNLDRFPEDFMFRLSSAEAESLRCQTGTLKTGRGRHL
jgi:hypothetical protein